MIRHIGCVVPDNLLRCYEVLPLPTLSFLLNSHPAYRRLEGIALLHIHKAVQSGCKQEQKQQSAVVLLVMDGCRRREALTLHVLVGV